MLFALSAVALAADLRSVSKNSAPVEGKCVYNGQVPVTYITAATGCGGASDTSGGFRADENSLTTVKECANYVKDRCGDKAAYVSFYAHHQGSAGDYLYEKGDCHWYASSLCACYDTDQCEKMPGAAHQYLSGSIADLTAATQQSGSGVAPVEDGTSGSGVVTETADDPAYTEQLASNVVNEQGDPEAQEFKTIPSADELDMEALREDPSKVLEESMKTASLESGCPSDRVASLHRGEWQCLERQSLNISVISCIVGGAYATMVITVAVLNMIGSAKRNPRKDEDELGDGLLEEEDEADA